MFALLKNTRFIFLSALVLFTACRKDITGIEKHIFQNSWETADASGQGFNEKELQVAFNEADQLGFVDCLLIVKNGYIVAEEYYNGFNESRMHNVKSVSKSFLSALTGIALREGFLDNLDQKMIDFFPEYNGPDLDPRKRDITLQHLLTMRMGLQEESYNFSQIFYTSNWIESIINWPLEYTPGSTFSYNTCQTHLLSAILTIASGMSTKALADKYLFEPMNISADRWDQDPSGYYFGGNSMYFTPREMAMLGYLYLHDGFINGQQLIPKSWLEESLVNRTGFKNNDWENLHDVNYGYLWWLGYVSGYKTFQAMGYGGQLVVCFPKLDMIVVTTSSKSSVTWGASDSRISIIYDIIAEKIIPAL